jgi:hypothetical protein
MIKIKLIVSYRVDIYIKQSLCDWFEKEYKLALEFTSIRYRNRIYNIDEKGARIICLTKKEIVVLISIQKKYIGVLENRFSVIVIEYIFVDKKVILLLVIIPGVMLME